MTDVDLDDDVDRALHHVAEKAEACGMVCLEWGEEAGLDPGAMNLAFGIQFSYLGAVAAVNAGIPLEAYLDKCREFYLGEKRSDLH